VLNNVGAGALGVVGSADPDGVQPGIPDPPFDCPNYLTALYNAAMQNPMETDSPTYRVYDDWNWAWGGAEATGAEGVYPDLNVFYYYQPVNGVQLGAGAVPVPPQPIRTTSRRMTLHRARLATPGLSSPSTLIRTRSFQPRAFRYSRR